LFSSFFKQEQQQEEKLSPFAKRILIVDDDPDTTLTFKNAFEEENRNSSNKTSFQVNTYNDPFFPTKWVLGENYSNIENDVFGIGIDFPIEVERR
jgi:hypothetical protein